MGPATPSPVRWWTTKRLLLIGGIVASLVALGFLAMGSRVLAAVGAVILALREAGPAIFFAAMAVLPAAGFPLLAFTVAAGPVFGPTLGTGWVIGWSLAAVVVNLLLTHWLSNRALRPVVSWLLTHFNFRLPDNMAVGAWQTVLIVRLTPGPPFWAQSYLLGLIRVPLVPYLVVSTLVMAGYIVALVWGGEAIARGNGRMAVAAAGVLVVTVAVLQLVRKYTARRRAAAVLPRPAHAVAAK